MRYLQNLLFCLFLILPISACQNGTPHLEPNAGSIDGGDSVLILGVTPAKGAKIDRVEFGGKPTGTVSIKSASEMQVTVPTGDRIGKVDVVVIDSHGKRTLIEDGFEYKPRKNTPTGTGGTQ